MAMSEQPQPVAGAAASTTKARTSFGILGAISLSHLLNDMIQSLILAIYPLLQSEFSLTFMQIGMITLTFQLASSLLQPVVGYWTDKYPMPWSLPIGMCFTLSGLVLLALAGSFGAVLLAAALPERKLNLLYRPFAKVGKAALMLYSVPFVLAWILMLFGLTPSSLTQFPGGDVVVILITLAAGWIGYLIRPI